VSADPQEAAREAADWLGPITILALLLFAVDTALVQANQVLPFDLPVARFIQGVPWGPLTYPMELINWLGGSNQILFGVVIVVALFFFDRRAGWLMAIGGISSLLDNLIKLSLQRHRPTADLVTILTPAAGFSYPSGHAVFFTWMSFMLAASVSPALRPRYRPIPWIIAGAVIVLTCLARVWAGAHWPSDVLGGFLLGLGWSAFVLWLPERLLPSPSVDWLRTKSLSPRGRG
jgi:undecaprenyl-diphosphatase